MTLPPTEPMGPTEPMEPIEPMGLIEPIGPPLWMTPDGIFHIPGRGTVLTGRLEGQGVLTIGDDLVCEGDHWPVTAIQMARSRPVKTADPGSEIGVLLRSCNTPDVLRGKTVQFVPKPGRIRARPAGGLARRLGRGRG